MELTVTVQQTETGYRAASSEPVPSVAEAPTRDEALALLHEQVQQQMENTIEVLTWHFPERHPSQAPILPDDELTQAWIDAIAENRRLLDEAEAVQ